jgi:hypothetical protein
MLRYSLLILLFFSNLVYSCQVFGDKYYSKSHLETFKQTKDKWHDVVRDILKGGFAYDAFKQFNMNDMLGPVIETSQNSLLSFGKATSLKLSDPLCRILLLGFHDDWKFFTDIAGNFHSADKFILLTCY